MEIPAYEELKAFKHTSFAHLYTFTGESFTNLTYYADITDSAGTKKVSFTITQDAGALTILLQLTAAQVNTLGTGTYYFDVKSINSTSSYIKRRIKGKFIVENSETVIT